MYNSTICCGEPSSGRRTGAGELGVFAFVNPSKVISFRRRRDSLDSPWNKTILVRHKSLPLLPNSVQFVCEEAVASDWPKVRGPGQRGNDAVKPCISLVSQDRSFEQNRPDADKD